MTDDELDAEWERRNTAAVLKMITLETQISEMRETLYQLGNEHVNIKAHNRRLETALDRFRPTCEHDFKGGVWRSTGGTEFAVRCVHCLILAEDPKPYPEISFESLAKSSYDMSRALKYMANAFKLPPQGPINIV